MNHIKQDIIEAFRRFERGNLKNAAISLFDTLGYRSDIGTGIEFESPEDFLEQFDTTQKLNRDNCLIEQWQSIEVLFQLTGDDIKETEQLGFIFEASSEAIDNTIIESYLFLAIKLQGQAYSRTALSNITREINKLTPMPAMLLFQHGQTLTLSVINRRLHKREELRDVLEKVTLIKDIAFAMPHRAHIEILFDLSLEQLYQKHGFTNFVALHRAWQKTLDSSELNKRFFREVANWYFWAVEQVTFPKDAGEPRFHRDFQDVENRNATSVIRLITRLIFVWFLKEKVLIPDALFNRAKLEDILNFTDPQESTYYKAILQNLFFATLNQNMNTDKEPDNRKFRGEGRQHYNITSLYRYKRYFKQPDEALRLFKSIPFLNGGLFECLDKPDKDNPKKILRIDGFSDRDDNELVAPDFLFFSEERDIDLNKTYGTSNKRYKVRGILNILDSYKFTINENTPIEEEVALDPELLGKVFENLLAAYNPETGATARKQTGSFYTPREIVNYMVDESLIAYLESKLKNGDTEDTEKDSINERLRHLIAYNDEPHRFSEQEVERLIEAIDTIKILDPACGSGAFPMGILHKLVYILGKLDTGNEQWKARQIAKANEIPDSTIRETVVAEIEQAFERNELDYGRKLYLIENCIYGVDIQPIATQIAKLRFFISLVVDQNIDDTQENRDILPLPNLETKFVAANTLIGIDTQLSLRTQAIIQKEKELADVRRRHFTARTPRTKAKYRNLDAQLRSDISELLKKGGFPSETTEKLAFGDPYDQNASADFFDTEWMFGITDGFDVVIGNPPYISHDKISIKDEIKRQYQSYQPFADIYCYFIERAVNLQNKEGFLSFITSNSYLRAEYGTPIRRFLKSKNFLLRVLNIEDSQIFDSAIVNVAIIVSGKSRNLAGKCCLVVSSPFPGDTSFEEFVQSTSFDYPQSAFSSKSWSLVEPNLVAIQEKLESSGTTLEKLGTKIRLGIATGSNEAFVIDEAKKQELCNKNPANSKIIRPILRGRDISRYTYSLPGLYILLTRNGVNVKRDYPDIYEHLESFGEKFKNRGAQGHHWTNLRACSFFDDFKKEKIVWIELTDVGRFALSREEVYLLNSAYFLLPPNNTPAKYLLGILNSSVIRFYLGLIAETSGMGTTRWINNYVKEFPIPNATPAQKASVIKVVDKILTAKRTDSTADTSALEREVDQLVYALYDLTPEDIAIVEGKANQPKEEPPKDEPQEIKENIEKFYKVRITKEQAAEGVRVAISAGDDKKISIRLPAGVSDGKRFRIKEHNLLLMASVEG